MKLVFADTVYFLALLNPSDNFHRHSRRLSAERNRALLTTEFVLMEVGDGMSRPENRAQFMVLLNLLRAQVDVEIVPANPELFRKSCELYSRRSDKEWSLTDCTSFVIMKERNIKQALTSDHHFSQAGFQKLLR